MCLGVSDQSAVIFEPGNVLAHAPLGGIAGQTFRNLPQGGTPAGGVFGGGSVLGPMLVADQPATGLRASAKPSPDTVPNNHVSYAVQWFLFAAAALVIYVLALRKKLKDEDSR